MGIKYIGERISPQSKFSVQYGTAYEKNKPITDPEKIKRVMAKYKYAAENNWVVAINIIQRDGNQKKMTKSDKVGKSYIVNDLTPHLHYVMRNCFYASYMRKSETDKDRPPFYISPYREGSLKFSKKEANGVKAILSGEGIKDISVIEYHTGLTGKYLGCELTSSNSIENRFSLMEI